MGLTIVFKKQIFVIITLGFCLGIISHDWLPNHYSSGFILFTLVFLTATIFIKFKRNLNAFLWLLLLFFVLGYQSVHQRIVPLSDENFTDLYVSESVVAGKVVDVSKSDKAWNKAIIELNYLIIDRDKIPISEKVLFLVNENTEDFERGDILLMNSAINPMSNKGNPGEFDAKNYWKAKGITQIGFMQQGDNIIIERETNALMRIFHWMDRSLSELFENRLKPESIGIAKALILGDRDHLDSEAVRSFGNAGAMHVLAVSGLHVGLILSLLIFVLGRFPKWISKYRATIISLILIWLYALLTGFSPSVFRAVVMFSLLTIAKLSGKNYDAINVLMASALILLLSDPLLLFDLGFQLSYLAMLGIFILYKPISKSIHVSNKWLRIAWEGTSVALAAQIFTLPLTLYCFHQFPNYFLISNLGLMVLTNVILIAGVLLIAFQMIPFLSIVVAWVLSISVIGMFLFVQWVESLPASTATGFELKTTEMILFYLLIGFILIAFRKKGNWSILASLTVIVVCSLLVSRKFSNQKVNEWVVFNESHLTFSLKLSDEIYCFYESDDDLAKSIYLLENYRKVYPGKIEYCKLNNGLIEMEKEGFKFSCKNELTFYDIKINDKSWKLIKRITNENTSDFDENSIYMPWFKLENVKGHQLQYGAFVQSIF